MVTGPANERVVVGGGDLGGFLPVVFEEVGPRPVRRTGAVQGATPLPAVERPVRVIVVAEPTYSVSRKKGMVKAAGSLARLLQKATAISVTTNGRAMKNSNGTAVSSV